NCRIEVACEVLPLRQFRTSAVRQSNRFRAARYNTADDSALRPRAVCGRGEVFGLCARGGGPEADPPGRRRSGTDSSVWPYPHIQSAAFAAAASRGGAAARGGGGEQPRGRRS